MAIGVLTSNEQFGTLIYDGVTVPTSRFYTTIVDAELIKFTQLDDNPIKCNSITVSAGSSDVYFVVWENASAKVVEIPDGYDFTGHPIYFVGADSTINVSGLAMGALKVLGLTGIELQIQAVGY